MIEAKSKEFLLGYQEARAEIRRKLFRMSLSSNAMDYVRGVGDLLRELEEEQ